MKLRISSDSPSPFRLLVVSAALAVSFGTPLWGWQANARESRQAVISVQGMQCPFCAYGIRKHLGKLPGARKVEVELARNRATVTFDPVATANDDDIRRAVRKAGFTAGTIAWRALEPESR